MSAARNNRRRYRRRGRFGFLYKLLAAVALAAALILGATVFFRVEEVIVSGNVRYTAQEVIDASGVERSVNLYSLNKSEIARQIRRLLPYVEAVGVRRDLPDTLVLTVTESRAAAWVSGGEGDWLISPAGKVLELVPAGSAPGVQLKGLDCKQPEAGAYLEVSEEQQLRFAGLLSLLSALDSRGMAGQVTEIDLSSSVRIVMDYEGRFTVRLPVSGDFDYLLEALEKAAATLEHYETGIMDLTVEDYTVVFSPS